MAIEKNVLRIDHPDRVVDVFHRNYREDRPEYLSAHIAHNRSKHNHAMSNLMT